MELAARSVDIAVDCSITVGCIAAGGSAVASSSDATGTGRQDAQPITGRRIKRFLLERGIEMK